MNSSLEWRRNKVQELASQGYNQSEISRILQISQPTINRDITFLRQQAKENIKRYIDEILLIVPVNFNKEHKAMLGHCKMILENEGGRIAINPVFDKLITSLRTA